MDIEEGLLKPDYHHNASNTTYKVMLIDFEFIEKLIMNSYQNVGNPAASKKTLVNVCVRFARSLIR